MHSKTIHFVLLTILLGLLSACAAPKATLDSSASSTAQPATPGAEIKPSEDLIETTSASNPADAIATPAIETAVITHEAIATPSITPENTPRSPEPTRTPPPLDAWVEMPIVPQVSARAIEIYQQGLQMGNDPHRFSKIGDCQNVSSYFLSPFEFASAYNLGKYSELQETIDWYKGSFTRESLAVKGGFNVAAVLSPLRADPEKCENDESPLQCELRVFNPSIAVVSMETWWSGEPEKYEKYMRLLLDELIAKGVLPILATKADNLEGGNQINHALSELAWEYDIPLWNFWASVQDLPNHGLTEDGFHLTLGNYFYNDPVTTRTGWSMRNLTALQALDAVQRAVNQTP